VKGIGIVYLRLSSVVFLKVLRVKLERLQDASYMDKGSKPGESIRSAYTCSSLWGRGGGDKEVTTEVLNMWKYVIQPNYISII
jgi:hypothetical protein